MTEKIEVEDITDKRENDDSPHAQHNLDVHDPNAYFDFLKKTRDDINKVSPSFCAAKWTQSTILLYSGETHSCHHPSRHKIQLSDIKDNPKGLHNTAHKMLAREEMLQGIQTKECDYCWRVENQNKEHISDRIYKSSYSWSLPHLNKIEQSGRGENFDPTYVEVAFDSTCNFKCIYCSPEASSRWEDEIRRHGDMKQTEFNLNNLDWLKSVGKLPIHHKEYNPYKEAFWEWWPELYPKLETFRITGGEPLLSKDTWKVFDYIKENPNPDLILAVNTNNNVPDKMADRLITNINEMQDNIKYFDIYTSFENTGKQAEYTREGMVYDEFIDNCYKILDNTPNSTRIHFMTTINLTSAPSLLGFLEEIKKMRGTKGSVYQPTKHVFRTRLMLNYLRWPRPLMLSLISKEDKQKYGDIWLEYMHANKLTEARKDEECFYLEEVDQMERLVEFMRNDEQPAVVYDDMRLYIKQLDERRNKNFCDTFPELSYLMDSDYYG